MDQKEQNIFNTFIEILKFIQKKEKDVVLGEIVKSMLTLRSLNRLYIRLLEGAEAQEYKHLYGFYSPFRNYIVVMFRKEMFAKKFFGLITDYGNINRDAINSLKSTFVHEMMHYVANNAFPGYMKVWNNEFRPFLFEFFKTVLRNNFDEFYSDSDRDSKINQDPKELNDSDKTSARRSYDEVVAHPDFNKAYDIYYNTVVEAIRYKSLTWQRIYEAVIEPIYKEVDFHIARYFDNIMTTAMEIRESHYLNKTTISIYFGILDVYKLRYPKIKGYLNTVPSLFHQEIYTPTEVSSYLSEFWKYDSHIADLVIDTLSLV
jgi:hypothetical protein